MEVLGPLHHPPKLEVLGELALVIRLVKALGVKRPAQAQQAQLTLDVVRDLLRGQVVPRRAGCGGGGSLGSLERDAWVAGGGQELGRGRGGGQQRGRGRGGMAVAGEGQAHEEWARLVVGG